MGCVVLLIGSQARVAHSTLRALSHRLLRRRLSSVDNPSLADGNAGLALAHAVLDSAFPGEGHDARSAKVMARAVAAVGATPLPPSLYRGFSGVAWVAEFLEGDTNGPRTHDPNAGIDAALEVYVARSPWHGPYDLYEGLVGLGVYALERIPCPSAARILALLVDRLEEVAVRRRTGVAWRSDSRWLPKAERTDPFPEWNLGLAHGVPGVIGFLSGVCAARVPASTHVRAHSLLEKAVAWLLAQELPKGKGGCFASAVAPKFPKTPVRSAWCYGDPGIAATLLLAADATGERRWQKEAIRIAVSAAKRPPGTAGAYPGICHGSAGLGHVFHRIYRAIGDARVAEAARSWFARTVAMEQSRTGYRGPGFLDGTAGIALALAAATSRRGDSEWDRALMLSHRPRGPDHP
jgi:hypothetical protein